MDARWELDPIEVPVARVGRLDEHVAEDVVRQPGPNAIDLVHAVDVHVQRITSADRELDLRAVRDRLGERGAGGLQRALRRRRPTSHSSRSAAAFGCGVVVGAPPPAGGVSFHA